MSNTYLLYSSMPKAHTLTVCLASIKNLGLDYTDIELSASEINYLEELYIPHALAGVMAKNGKQKAGNVV